MNSKLGSSAANGPKDARLPDHWNKSQNEAEQKIFIIEIAENCIWEFVRETSSWRLFEIHRGSENHFLKERTFVVHEELRANKSEIKLSIHGCKTQKRIKKWKNQKSRELQFGQISVN